MSRSGWRQPALIAHHSFLIAGVGLLWALALALSTLGYVVGRTVYERGAVYGPPGPALPDLDGPQRAINTQLELEPDLEAQRRSLRLIHEAGFGWIRQPFQWADVEGGGKGQFFDTTRGRSTWADYDQMVRLAGEAGLRVIARIDRPPAWARPPGSSATHPPLRAQDYGDFVAAFVDHYRGQIDYVQLWNEPNLTNEWGDQPVDPAAYVELLKAGYEGAKRADPAVRVLSGELAQTLEPDAPGARGLDDLLYLQRMYDLGARPFFDILAANAYGLRTGPADRQLGAAYTNFPRVLLVREIMERHGDGAKPVWVTEFGWNALPDGWQGDPSPWGKVSAQNQARYIAGAYERARIEWPWMGPMALWLFHMPGANPRDPTPYFGLVDAEWQPRPAYAALRDSRNADASVLGPGVHQETAAGIDFGGTWQWTPDPAASLGGLRETPVSGAIVKLRFRGTRVELLAPVGPSRGLAYARINGAYTLANRLPLNQFGQATIDSFAPQPQAQQRIVIADSLPDRVHDLEIAIAGEQSSASSGPGVGVDAIVISRARPVTPLILLGGAWVASAVALAWALREQVVARLAALALAIGRGLQPPTAGPGHTPGAAALASLVSRGLQPTSLYHGSDVTGSPYPRLLGPSDLGPRTSDLGLRLAQSIPWRKASVLAVAAVLPLAPVTVRTPGGRYSPVELLLLLALGAGIIALYAGGRLPGRRGAFTGPAITIVAAGLISLFVADYPRLGLRELRTLILEPVAFYFLARSALRGPRDGLFLAGCFLAGASAAATLALAETVLGHGLVAAEGVGRAAALYPSPNNLALLLDRAVPLAAGIALYWGNSRGMDALAGGGQAPALQLSGAGLSLPLGEGIFRRPRLLFAGAAVLCSGALFFTFSKGAWLATGSALAALALPLLGGLPRAHRRRTIAAVVAASVPVLLALIAVALRFERFRSMVTGLLRLYLWRASLDMIRDHPLWGVGLDQFLYHYPRYMLPQAWREPNLSHPHNVLLDFWLRLGILGVAALLWSLWIFSRRVRVLPAGDPRSAALLRGAGAAGLALLLHGLVDNSYFVLDLAYATWIVLLLVELAIDPAAAPAAAPAARRDQHAGATWLR